MQLGRDLRPSFPLVQHTRPRPHKKPIAMASRQYADSKPVKKGFIVLVTGKLAPGHIDTFKEVFKPLAAHVAENEEGCFAYEMSVCADDPDKFIIYERYTDKEYVEQVHWQSGPFKAFQERCKEVGIDWLEKNVVTYYEQDIGF